MSKANILIVDDDPLVADSLAVFLRRRHYEVVVETDSHRALKVLRDKTPIDLLLSDVNMPETLRTFQSSVLSKATM